jgi:threonine dehydrogenase-like Zn-dependent dehydrogenase
MKAVCWEGTGHVRVEDRSRPDDPQPARCGDPVTSTAICGSDLHLFDGFIPTMKAAISSATSSWASSKK